MPDAPAPITARLPGSSSSAHAVSVPSTRPPNFSPSTGLGTEPTAITTFSASISSPSFWAPIRTLASSVSAPWPSISSILFLSKRKLTPLVSVLTTFSRWAATPEKSTDVPSTSIPNDPASSTSVLTSAARRTALAGMQA